MDGWLDSLRHKCTGMDCDFCQRRQANPIELAWEKLWDHCDLPANFALSTQQTIDFLANADLGELNDFPDIGVTVEKQAEAAGQSSVHTASGSATVLAQSNPPSLTVPARAAANREEAGVQPSTATTRVYGSPKSEKAVSKAIASGIPEKTKKQTEWTVRVWEQWAKSRNSRLLPSEQPFSSDFGALTRSDMKFWLCRFVLEVRKVNGEPYNPTTLYQICCGLLRHLRVNCDRSDVNFLDDCEFQQFQSTLDAEMKRLNGTGRYVEKRQAQVITPSDEDYLWSLQLLGEQSPQVLLDTIVHMIGLYFALRSGNEHRRLRHNPSQLQVVEPPDGRAYIIYREDVSKTNQGGVNSRKKKPKEVVHYANTTNPERCFVRIFKLYNSRCPSDRPDNALYLKPLSTPKGHIWYSKVPLGHNLLQNTVARLMKSAKYMGYYTNHSLRASAAMRLFTSGVDEQAIMSVTGHSSTDGVRAYKRMCDKLREVTSDVLNQGGEPAPAAKKQKVEEGKENLPVPFDSGGDKDKASKSPKVDPVFQISGGSHITINIGCA